MWRSGPPTVVLLAFTGLVVFGIIRLVAIEKTMRIDNATNMLWVITQSEVEALRLKVQLMETPEDGEAIARRYDLLSSRIALLFDGPQLRYLDDRGVLENFEQEAAAVNRFDPERDAGSAFARRELSFALEKLERTLNRAANRTMVVEWDNLSLRLERYRSAVGQVVYSLLGVMAAAIYLGWRIVTDQRLKFEAQELARRSKRLEQDLDRERATVAYWRDFAAVVSHQFRTPLAVIDSAAQRLLRRGRSLDNEALAEKQKTIRDTVASLDRLVDAALLVGQLDNGLKRVDARYVDLVPVVFGLVKDMQIRLGERKIRFLSNDTSISAYCDPQLVIHILMNLIDNAAKYSGDTAPIKVELATRDGLVSCSVRDYGCGVAIEMRDKLFERFRRGSADRPPEGSGIGLWTARRLADLLGGRILLESEPGAGATFTLLLPNEKKPEDRGDA